MKTNIYTNRLSSKAEIETLPEVLSNMLGGKEIIHADYQTSPLQGGTLGEVQLVSGNVQSVDGDTLPFNIVLKRQKKWERYGDPESWRREYDLYQTDFATLFSESFRWPECYYHVMNEEENETQLWLEYIDGVSGLHLTGDMVERAAEQLGRFQGKLYAEKPTCLNLTNLSKVEYMKNFYLHYRSWTRVHDYIRSNACEIPKHLCDMLIDVDERADDIFNRIAKLPIVMCHRDFWVENIFYADGNIIAIDWDTTGWGYLGEDLASLLADEVDIEHMVEYCRRCIPAYYKGFSEYADISHIADHCIPEMMLLMFGYRLVEWYMDAMEAMEAMDTVNVDVNHRMDAKHAGEVNQKADVERKLHIDTLQKIYEIRNL